MSSIEEVKQQLAGGRGHIEAVPTAAVHAGWEELDVGSLIEKVGEAIGIAASLRATALRVRSLSLTASEESRMGRQCFINATTGTTNADAIDMIGGAEEMENLGMCEFVRAVSLVESFRSAEELLTGLKEDLEASEAGRLAATQKLQALAETQAGVLEQVDGYVAQLG